VLAVIGMPRSGTTWVAKVFDSHPDTYYLHEPDSVRRMELPQIIGSGEALDYAPYLDNYLRSIESVVQLKVVGRLPFFPKSYLNPVQFYFNRFSALTSKVLGRFFIQVSKGSPILIKPAQYHQTLWKSIESMGRVSALVHSNSDLKMLLLVRHPCAVINSELKGEAAKQFASGTPIYEDWGVFQNLVDSEFSKSKGLTIAQLKKMKPSERLAWKWLIYYQQLIAHADNPKCFMIAYEKLCTDPMKFFPEAFEFFGLSFDQQVKNYLVESTASHSDSYYATSKDPAKAMNSWKEKLPQEDISAVLEIVGDYLDCEYWAK